MTTESVIPTCYRHPDRQTRLACSNCDRPVCVDCVRTAAVGQRCLECANERGAQRVMTMDDVRRAAVRSTPVAYAILVVCAAVFLCVQLPGVGGYLRRFALIPENVALGQWWLMITSAFMHIDWWHIMVNLYALYLFGPPLEREVGSAPFAALYLASGISGSLAYYLIDGSGNAVGASGALFGLLGAWLVASYRGRHTTLGAASLRTLLWVLALNLVIGFVPQLHIGWEAHLGGLVAGAALAWVWSLRPLQGNASARTVVALAVAVAAMLPVL